MHKDVYYIIMINVILIKNAVKVCNMCTTMEQYMPLQFNIATFKILTYISTVLF